MHPGRAWNLGGFMVKSSIGPVGLTQFVKPVNVLVASSLPISPLTP